jgi:protein phosphatase
VGSQPRLEEVYGTLRPGDSFLLCSDGLTGHVKDPEIAEAMRTENAQQTAQSLVDLTLERGATDNVTVVVVRCLAPEENYWAEEPANETKPVETTEIDWSIGT